MFWILIQLTALKMGLFQLRHLGAGLPLRRWKFSTRREHGAAVVLLLPVIILPVFQIQLSTHSPEESDKHQHPRTSQIWSSAVPALGCTQIKKLTISTAFQWKFNLYEVTPKRSYKHQEHIRVCNWHFTWIKCRCILHYAIFRQLHDISILKVTCGK
jgi:hypothetical protein